MDIFVKFGLDQTWLGGFTSVVFCRATFTHAILGRRRHYKRTNPSNKSQDPPHKHTGKFWSYNNDNNNIPKWVPVSDCVHVHTSNNVSPCLQIVSVAIMGNADRLIESVGILEERDIINVNSLANDVWQSTHLSRYQNKLL